MERCVHRIEVHYTADPRLKIRTSRIRSLGFPIDELHLIDVYTIAMNTRDFSGKELADIGSQLINPVVQKFLVDTPTRTPFDYAIEVGFLPGVTDNIGNTARQTIEDFFSLKFVEGEAVYTSQLFLVCGTLSAAELTKLTSTLANPLVNRVHVKSRSEYGEKGMDAVVPVVHLNELTSADIVDLDIEDTELARIGKEGIIDSSTGLRRGPLALDTSQLHAIRDYFDAEMRWPTDIELESLAQTWSEHCKHTIFASPMDDDVPRGLYKTFIQDATNKIRAEKGDKDICVTVFTDNSGSIIFDDTYLVTHKVETHNSPSALDPFGGALTGIVGVNRDTIGFGLGAKPCINFYGYCVGDPDTDPALFRGKNRSSPILSPRHILDGVVRGVGVGGNCSGIPTPQGWCWFDDRYGGKPLVFAGTVGVMPREHAGRKLYEKAALPGDLIVVAGGRVGKDGIHGATFSSEALDPASPVTAVQIGDPITQKKLSDVIVKEARDLDLYRSITDNGAGGISCSVAEMAKECNGCHVQLDNVPLKYHGMAPWEIWISESQERMTLAVPPEKLTALMNLMQDRNVEATVIGKFTASGKCIVEWHGNVVMDIDLGFLHDGMPKQHLQTTYTPKTYPEPDHVCPERLDTLLRSMLGRKNLCSKEFISIQYDHTVQGGHVLGPVQGIGRVQAVSSLTKVVPGSKKGVGLSQGLFPSYSEIDPYLMAGASIDTAIRGLIAIGIPLDTIAILDNFCWCSSDEPERLGQLKRAAQGCYDFAVAFGTPFISGKDSMYNDFSGFDADDNPVRVSVPPTLLISSIGIHPDVAKSVSMDAKIEGDLVYVMGDTAEELGGSEYFALLGGTGNTVPKLDAVTLKARYARLTDALSHELVASAFPVSHGGLGTALSKVAIAGQLGMDITIPSAMRPDYYLFSESLGRFVVTVAPDHKREFERICGADALLLGRVGGKNLRITSDKLLLDLQVAELETVYKAPFRGVLIVAFAAQRFNTRATGSIRQSDPVQIDEKALIMSGFGINSEMETKEVLVRAGMDADIVHINDLIAGRNRLSEYRLLVFPGGFSYGDDTGAGNAYANRVRNNLWDDILEFLDGDNLVLGICNGFQILANLGLVPAFDKHYSRDIALMPNRSGRLECRFVSIRPAADNLWTRGIERLYCPVAHGEGNFSCSPDTLLRLKRQKMLAFTYCRDDLSPAYGEYPWNPNGSVEDIAGITSADGKVLGLMPHPERAMEFVNLYNWPLRKEEMRRKGVTVPPESMNMQLFRNAVEYFR